MKHYSVKPLSVALHSSRWLAMLLGVGCLAGMTLTLIMPLPIAGKTILMLLLLVGTGYHELRHAALRLPQSINGLEVSLRGEFRCHARQHGWQNAQVLGSSFVTPWLTVLHLRLEGRYFVRHVILLPDALDAQDFRALRVWLRWGGEVVLADG